MSKIKVHVLNFWGPLNSHIEIVLEQDSLYYRITPWEAPRPNAQKNDSDCLKAIQKASESNIIEIDQDLSQIIEAWKAKYRAEEEDFGCIVNNCADVSAWFLETFANITNPGRCDLPITVNYLTCGIFAPSFLQCCTLPGRVFDYAESHTELTTPLKPKNMLKQ